MKKYVDRFWSDPFDDDDRVLSPMEEMIAKTNDEWYEAKHGRQSEEEIKLINSIRPEACPHCRSGKISRDGKRDDGVQRFRCGSCGRRFNALTGTLMDSRRIPLSEWLEFVLHLFEFHSLRTSSRDNRNVETTGHYWLSKVFAALEGCQDSVVLRGRVWFDETFVSVDKADRKSGPKGSPRGLSRNKVCIAVATDGDSTFIAVEGKSKSSAERTCRILVDHIEPGSTLVHDGDNSHSLLIWRLKLASEVHPTSETKGLADRDNPLDPVNDVHSKIKEFLRSHKGVRTDNLEDWLNLFWLVWTPPHNRYEKAARLLQMIVSCKKVIRFRDFYGKKTR